MTTAVAGKALPEATDSLGATLTHSGVRFAVHAPLAERVTLCLFDERGEREVTTLPMAKSNGRFAAEVQGLKEGQRYGFRADGPYRPEDGLFFDPAKLLVDPYARRIDRAFIQHADHRAPRGGPDTAPVVPKSIVCAEEPDVLARAPLWYPGGIFYELSVRAFTMRHPDVPEHQRGTLAALRHPSVIRHLKRVGIGAVELMPIVAWIDERHLGPLGLTNAWGYNPVNFFALDPRLAPRGIADLRETVSALHSAGIGVIMDVVYNHTGESDADGSVLSMRGLDPLGAYRHANGQLVNDTGCGNTVACDMPQIADMVIDSLRFFVRKAGIDGFRFDLGPILGRDANGFRPDAALLNRMRSDPVLHDRVLVMEPWDIGPGGYQLGQFGEPFLEWNDRARDDVRMFWRGDDHKVGALATRLSGSADLFRHDASAATRSVNFLAAHDGFSLHDLVSYSRKHNRANGEDNRDGHNENHSWNNGIEGATDDPAVIAARRSDIKALLSTLFSMRGAVLLTAGDEFGRTQGGNNNAYCQDNEITWLDWAERDLEIEGHVAFLARLRRTFSCLGDPAFLNGAPRKGEDLPDVQWLRADGQPMQTGDWENPRQGLLVMMLAVAPEDDVPARRLAVVFNRSVEPVTIALDAAPGHGWIEALSAVRSKDRTIRVSQRSVGFFVETPR